MHDGINNMASTNVLKVQYMYPYIMPYAIIHSSPISLRLQVRWHWFAL